MAKVDSLLDQVKNLVLPIGRILYLERLLVILDLPFQIIPKLLHTGNQPPYKIGRLIPKSNYQFQCTVSACSHLGSLYTDSLSTQF